MEGVLLAFAAGAALFQLSPILPDPIWLSAATPLVLLWRFPRVRPLVALAAGLCWAAGYAAWMLDPRLPPEQEGRDLRLQGRVVGLPLQRAELARLQVRVVQLEDSAGVSIPLEKIQLSWYRAPAGIEPGQVWQWTVRLKRPRGLGNPAGFDYERWLFTQGIQATGYVRQGDEPRLLIRPLLAASLDGWRASLAEAIDGYLQPGPANALVKALSLGDRRRLDAAAREVFSRTGTSHLIAISGLHVGLVAGWLWFLGQWCWRRFPALALRLPAQRAGAIPALLGALGYAALAGFSLPTLRALAMLTVALGGVLLAQPIRPVRSLSLALFLVVLLDPTAPLSAGFWLSFGAVALILLVLAGRLGRPGRWGQLLRVQMAVSLGLLPALLLLFGEASVIAPGVNLLLVPWFALVLVPMSLIGLLLLPLPAAATLWYGWLDTLAGQTFWLLQQCAQLPFATLQMNHLPVWMTLAALLGVVWMLLPAGVPGRTMGLLLVVPLLWSSPSRPERGSFWFTLLDVGQGLACVVETADHVMLYDTGPAFASGFSTAEAAVLPFLSRRGYPRIDRLVLSNADRDHAGGVETVLAALPVGDLLSGEPERLAQARPCHPGERWEWDGVSFEVLHPSPGAHYLRANDRSCVVRVSNRHWSLLLPGDIEAEGERQLMESGDGDLATRILVAPHHGSATSSSQAFVEAVAPEWVLFSTGYRNRYGFPRPSVAERWRRSGARLVDTAESGAVSFRLPSDARAPQIVLQRERTRHYWSPW